MIDDNALVGVVAAAAAVVAVVAADELPAKRRKREMWVRPMLQCRQLYSARFRVLYLHRRCLVNTMEANSRPIGQREVLDTSLVMTTSVITTHRCQLRTL